MVQQWVDGSKPNYGVVLLDQDEDEVGLNFKTFTSSEYGDVTKRPILRIRYYSPVPVTGVEVAPSTMWLVQGGDTGQLSANVLPDTAANKNVHWMSSDPSVAMVDANGVVTPVGSGTAVVTATTEDGNYTDSSTVTVAGRNADLSDLTLSEGMLSPVFASGLTGYSATVANSVTSVDVTPVAADPNAAITVNGHIVESGSPTTVPLSIGNNIVKVIVTAEDGTTQKLYTVTVTRPPSTNADLSDLSLSDGEMSPAFSGGTLSYRAAVGYSVSEVSVTLTTADPNATVTVNGQTVTSGIASQPIPLSVGDNTINVTVTAQDGTTTKTYTVIVNRAGNNVAHLTNLKVSEGSLAPVFVWNTYQYRVGVANHVTGVSATPTVADPNATVTVNGHPVASGTASSSIPLSVGDNAITVTVTAEDGTTTRTYTVIVNRAASANANLNNLSLSDGPLSPDFASGVTVYSSAVTNSVYGLTITPTVAEVNATVTVNGHPVTSGTESQWIPLNVGDNAIDVTVTAQDGTTTKTYSVTVTRAPNDSADLTNLELSDGVLSPAFEIGTSGYRATVTNSVYDLTVTPTTADPNATVTVNGLLVTSGTASSSISLDVGDNLINVTVTAQDGLTTKTYTVTVTRAASNSADLSNLSLSEGSLSPAFASGESNYTATVASNVPSVKVTLWTADSNATVMVNGNPAISGKPSGPIPLNPGNNLIVVTVTAEDGTTTKTYNVNVIREAGANADLSNLALSSGSLSPAFTAGVTGYTATVGIDVTSVTVTPTASDPNATLSVNGMAVASGGSSSSIPLNEGDNPILVTVTAEDGTTTKTYNVNVIREASANADLSNLALSNGSLSPAFAAGVTGYTATVGNDVTSVTVTPTASDPNATLSVNGLTVANGVSSSPIPLNVGDNPILVTVTAEDGTTTKTYTIVVIRMNEDSEDDGDSDSGNGDSDSGNGDSDSGNEDASSSTPSDSPSNSPEDMSDEPDDTENPAEQPVAPMVACTVHSWADVSNHWARSYIETASQLCVVEGMSNDRFMPDESATRLQFALMVARAMKLQNAGNIAILEAYEDGEDIPEWAAADLSAAVEAGILVGYDDHTLRPNAQISRAEMVTMLIRSWGMSASNASTLFADDANIPDWARGYVAKAAQIGIIEGRSNNRFEPSSAATRSEAVMALVRMLEFKP